MSNEEQSAQYRTTNSSRREFFPLTRSLRRLGTFWAPADRGNTTDLLPSVEAFFLRSSVQTIAVTFHSIQDRAHKDTISCLYSQITCLCVSDEGDAHPVVPDVAQTEEEEERSPGLPWIELEALFGQDAVALDLETVDAEGRGRSRPPMKWSRDNITQ